MYLFLDREDLFLCDPVTDRSNDADVAVAQTQSTYRVNRATLLYMPKMYGLSLVLNFELEHWDKSPTPPPTGEK